ncbi:MAG: DUF4062 domain-containing protein [Nevskia sp.]|nr:DUF4062 domain-containing protein [Nevskia sp.]
MKEKYQVFVSSTYEDLKAERDEAIKAVLEMGHIPVGMEMFSAGDETQWELIKRQINDSDYYVIIAAHRYGSLDGDISYTEKEYDYAVSKGIPVLGFIISDDASWPKSLIETDVIKAERLNQFKQKIKQKMVSWWSAKEQIHAKVSVALSKAITAYPRSGWVRSSGDVGSQVTAELSRLSQENAALREENRMLTAKKIVDDTNEKKKTIELLQRTQLAVAFFFKDEKDWTAGPPTSLYRIFRLLAPEMVVELSFNDADNYLGQMLPKNAKDKGKKIRDKFPLPSNSVKEWLADIHALGLVQPSERKHPVSDDRQYWSLSERGKSVYAMTRIEHLEKKASDPTTKPMTVAHD